jgi:hypothetical protein
VNRVARINQSELHQLIEWIIFIMVWRDSGLFGVVARPQQVERALCARAELSFGPEAV